MYLFAGENTIINEKYILGIFDTDSATMSSVTRQMLKSAEKKGEITYITTEIPKSFILTSKNGENRIYMSQLSSKVLLKRLKNGS